MTISKGRQRIIQKFNFLNDFEKGKILMKDFDMIEMNFFYHNCETGQILLKTVLSLKMSHKQLN